MQYNFDIKIPEQLITEEKHDSINFDLLDGKSIIGCMGYAASGKDSIANKFIEKYGYKRIAFADNLKNKMNEFIREDVYQDLKKSNVNMSFDDIDFVNTKDRKIKEIIRPYIIWFGETIRSINGPFYWVNKMFQEDAKGFYNLVISDVRRPKELDIFRESNNFLKRTTESFAEGSYFKAFKNEVKTFSTLLFHVNQYGLKDSDLLTIETIKLAQEDWLIDDTFYIDSRLPDEKNYRNKAIDNKVSNIAKKYGIESPDKIQGIQTNMHEAFKQ